MTLVLSCDKGAELVRWQEVEDEGWACSMWKCPARQAWYSAYIRSEPLQSAQPVPESLSQGLCLGRENLLDLPGGDDGRA